MGSRYSASFEKIMYICRNIALSQPMGFKEIIEKLIARDNAVVDCFFFWEGPTLEHIKEVSRTDPVKAAQMKRPVCETCRPLLLRILHDLYGAKGFNYRDMISLFYLYLVEKKEKDNKCPLETIEQPEALMGWIATTAYYYFLGQKKKIDKARVIAPQDPLIVIADIVDDTNLEEIRTFVDAVIKAMPNRKYADIIDNVVLELAQYSGKQRIDKKKELTKEYNKTPGAMDVIIFSAKKQFRETALRIQNNKTI